MSVSNLTIKFGEFCKDNQEIRLCSVSCLLFAFHVCWYQIRILLSFSFIEMDWNFENNIEGSEKRRKNQKCVILVHLNQ